MKQLEQLPPDRQRALAVGILVILLLAVYMVLVDPIVSMHQDYNQRVEQLQERLAGFQRIAASQQSLDKAYKQLRRTVAVQNSGYVNGETEALAAAEMQGYVKRIVEENGGHLTSIQILSDNETDEPAPRIALKVQITGAIETVQKVFYALESGQPYVFLEDVYLHSRSAYTFRPNQPQLLQMDIRFNLYSYLQPKGS
jgi:general secretion pathway protein M